MTKQLRSFLACYDYGTGGVWLLLDAPSHEAAQRAYPELIVYETRPKWMNGTEESEYRDRCIRIGYRWNILEAPTGWLKKYAEGEGKTSG
jgi:hypothetical protein